MLLMQMILRLISHNNAYMLNKRNKRNRGVAQLVEFWSPKPAVMGSNPLAPATNKQNYFKLTK